MTQGLFVTGTDTHVGKTVAAAWLTLHLGGCYWKPVQAGLQGETDTEFVRRLTGAEALPEAWRLPDPLSPHEAARRAGATIDLSKIVVPPVSGPFVVEGAGGLLVPLNDHALVIDLIALLGFPVILVSRSSLGTINHTLLSLEALRRRNIAIAGVVMNGPRNAHNRAAIERYGQVRVIVELPPLQPLNRTALLGIAPECNLGSLTRLKHERNSGT